MNEAQNVTEFARNISDYGFMVVVCAVFLILSMGLMVTCFKWFKSVIEKIMGDYSKQLEKIQETATSNNEAMLDIAEGLIPETQLRIKNISNSYFDLAAYKVAALIKKIRTENHIADHEATQRKIRTLLKNLYEDRNSRFDSFRYRGQRLSEYCNPEWIEQIARVVEAELYSENGVNDERAFTNITAAYDNIKLDFYHRLQK